MSEKSTSPDAVTDTRTISEDEKLQLVTFMIGQEEFAVNILDVQEINRMMTTTHVPGSPEHVQGVVNLRGQIVPVVDLRRRLGLEPREPDAQSRIIVVEVQQRTIGFIVDRVNEVLRTTRGIVEPAPSGACEIDMDYIEGVGKLEDRMLILLELDRLFSDAEIDGIDAAAGAAQNDQEAA